MKKTVFFKIDILLKGKTIKKKIDIHKLAEANKAYAHYKWKTRWTFFKLEFYQKTHTNVLNI